MKSKEASGTQHCCMSKYYKTLPLATGYYWQRPEESLCSGCITVGLKMLTLRSRNIPNLFKLLLIQIIVITSSFNPHTCLPFDKFKEISVYYNSEKNNKELHLFIYLYLFITFLYRLSHLSTLAFAFQVTLKLLRLIFLPFNDQEKLGHISAFFKRANLYYTPSAKKWELFCIFSTNVQFEKKNVQ